MQLKKLELYGFKSFSDKTRVEFDKGITAIVGPNGSGKSNIVDAIQWVLGEQSVKNLRGSKMEDVVFKGSDKRKANGFAEVTLTLDNSDEKLPISFAEVQVSRRLYRSGESVYMINGAECRLKDITNLFMDSGIGKYGYSIIGQGRVSEILNTTPEGRRYIFDEAAGIMKFKNRKEEATKHLFLTQENLARANDLIYELDSTLPQLKAAAERADQYLSVANQLKECETDRFVLLYKRYQKSIEKIQEQSARLNHDIAQNTAAKTALEDKLKQVTASLEEFSAKCSALRENQLESIRTVERLKGEQRLLTEHIAQIEREKSQNEGVIEASQVEAQQLQEWLQTEKEKQNEMLEEQIVFKMNIGTRTQGADSLKSEHTSLSEQLQQARQEHLRLVNKESELQVRITELSTRKAMLLEQKKSFHKSDASEKKVVSQSQQEAERAKALLEEQNAKLDRLTAEFEEENKQYTELSDRYGEIVAHAEAKSKAVEAQKSRLQTLKELKESMEVFNNSTKAVLRLKKSNNPFAGSIIGAVSDVIRVKKEHEIAIEVALGGALQNIVVETDTAAKQIIEYLRNNRLGYATFLPLNTVQSRHVSQADLNNLRQRGFVGIGSDLVEYDSRYSNIVENLLGRVVIAQNMDAALAIAKASRYLFKIVTLDGSVINPYGSISGGSRRSNAANVFSRTREADELEASLREEMAQLQKLSKDAAQTKEALAQLSGSLNAKRSQLHEADIQASEAKKNWEFAEENHRKSLSSQEGRTQQLQNIEDEVERASAEIERSSRMLEECRKVVAQAAQMIEQLSASESEFQQKLSAAESELTQARIEQLEHESQLKILTASVEDVEQRRTSLLEKITSLTRKNEEISADLIQSAHQEKLLAEKVAGVERQEKSETDSVRQYEEKIKELESSKHRHEEDIRQFEGMIFEINQKLHDQELEQSRVSMESDNLQERMWEVYQVSLGDALAAAHPEEDMETLNRKIREIKGEITRMGTINPEAPAQYEAQYQRWQKLCSERDDLIAAGNDIEKLIADITKEMRQRFEEEFKIINVYFTEMFKKLFNGGSASLELCNSDDVLEAGIDIIAQPPGKKLQNISLLSGGEKALIAIALLFALLKRSPAPFCVLDEIDTALDEKNVYMLADLIKNFNEDIQFIIISHRKGTMEASNALYGVSMEEKGVSSLVSVRLEDQKPA